MIKEHKVISLSQPWATMVVTGLKSRETRSWQTKHRGELLIHASQKIPKEGQALFESELFQKYFSEYLMKWFEIHTMNDFPVGKIIGGVQLLDCAKVVRSDASGAILTNDHHIQMPELLLGDFERGRWIWELSKAFTLNRPIEKKGQLSVWKYFCEDWELGFRSYNSYVK